MAKETVDRSLPDRPIAAATGEPLLHCFPVDVGWPAPPLHIHAGMHEFFCVLRGDGRQADSLGDYPVRPGDCFLFPAGIAHGACRGRQVQVGLVLNLADAAVPAGGPGAEARSTLAAVAAHCAARGGRLPLSPAGREEVRAALAGMVAERSAGQPGHRIAMLARLLDLLAALRRDAELARAIGFAADQGGGQDARIANLCRWLGESFRAPVPVARMCEVAGMGRSQLFTAFRRQTGASPLAYLQGLRLAEAERLLRGPGREVAAVALDCGFGSLGRFYAAFRRHAGCAPAAFRRAALRGTAG